MVTCLSGQASEAVDFSPGSLSKKNPVILKNMTARPYDIRAITIFPQYMVPEFLTLPKISHICAQIIEWWNTNQLSGLHNLSHP